MTLFENKYKLLFILNYNTKKFLSSIINNKIIYVNIYVYTVFYKLFYFIYNC